MPKLKVAVLGASGSIGVQALEVARRHPDRFSVVLIANRKNSELLARQATEFGAFAYCESLSDDKDFLSRIDTYADVDLVVNGIAGLGGLAPSVAVLGAGKILATANKESIVCFGKQLKALAKQSGGEIRPVDSEHSTIWQCLENQQNVKRILITASGGAFRDYSVNQLKTAKAAAALKHPNWLMGEKVTVDCATMVNKGLEIIEAKQIFGISQVVPVLHRESVIHSMVEYADGTVKAGLSAPSMITPIQYAMCYPDRLPTGVDTVDLFAVGALHFENINLEKFPALAIAQSVADKDDEFYNTVFVAADEVLVKLYLQDRISYFDIPKYIEAALSHTKYQEISQISDVLHISEQVTSYILSIVGGREK